VARNYTNWILRTLVVPNVGRRVLEVGSGIGTYSAGMLASPAVHSLTCIELDRACAEQARDVLGSVVNDKPVAHLRGDYQLISLPPASFDTVVCLNVLEHLEHDGQAIKKAFQELGPGGQMIIYVPAFEWLSGPIDVQLGHFRRYTKKTLAPLLLDAGFEIRGMRYYNIAGFVGWLVRFRVLRRRNQNPTVVGVFDSLVFPVQARLEQVTPWQPIGQSLFALASKPEPLKILARANTISRTRAAATAARMSSSGSIG
jgi:SAM-dependent methyltransferase